MKLCAFFVIFSCSISFAAIADFLQGQDCFRSGDFSCALVEWQKAAAAGDSDALLGLAVMYREGKGVQKDETKAFDWVHKAGAQGQRLAQLALGAMYEEGHHVKRDYAKAVEWYQKAATQKVSEAQEALGRMYLEGKGVKQDDNKAYEWFTKASVQGSSSASQKRSLFYGIGQGVTTDVAKALEWNQKAAARGDADAQMRLSRWYENGEIVKQDATKALEWLQKAAAQGQPAALEHLGHWHITRRNYTKGVELFQKAAAQGYWSAQARLGEWYEYGQYVTRDYGKAIEWSQKAAVQGDRYSQKRVLRLSEILKCEKSAKTKLFGVLVKCANRDQLTAAVKNAGGKEKLEDKNHRIDVYHSATLLKGSSELAIYTHYGNFVKAQYTFPSHLDAQQILRVQEFVSNKYGNPTTSSGNAALGDASFEWRLGDGIILEVSRGWPDTTTYLKFTNPEIYQAMQAEQEREKKEREAKEYRKQSNAF